MRTALIEREHVGGTCINEGCTPTKTMVASGARRLPRQARRGLRRETDNFASTWRAFASESATLSIVSEMAVKRAWKKLPTSI